MRNYQKEILTALVDKYERSKEFAEIPSTSRPCRADIEKMFPEYGDDAKMDEVIEINRTIEEMEAQGLLSIRRRGNAIPYAVELNKKKTGECYAILKREPKADLNRRLADVLNKYIDKCDITRAFCSEQFSRMAENKKPEHFNGKVGEYELILKGLSAVKSVEQETYERDFSVRVFSDSKVFERIKGTLASILCKYEPENFPSKDCVMQDLNIIKNPGHVYFKGCGIITIAGQTIDVGKVHGDIALSSESIKDIENVLVTGTRVVTVENLTTFNRYSAEKEFVLYLGGYHNTIRGEFLKNLKKWNEDAEYWHFGDIDAGGFDILLNLRRKTGINFKAMHMDADTIARNKERAKTLTENDRKRLEKFLGGEFDEVVSYMLNNNCKLEQEAVDL